LIALSSKPLPVAPSERVCVTAQQSEERKGFLCVQAP
jgi:hypothetical protein